LFRQLLRQNCTATACILLLKWLDLPLEEFKVDEQAMIVITDDEVCLVVAHLHNFPIRFHSLRQRLRVVACCTVEHAVQRNSLFNWLQCVLFAVQSERGQLDWL
jgi:hypothetical protein